MHTRACWICGRTPPSVGKRKDSGRRVLSCAPGVRGTLWPRADVAREERVSAWVRRTLTKLPIHMTGGEPGLAVDDGREASAGTG